MHTKAGKYKYGTSNFELSEKSEISDFSTLAIVFRKHRLRLWNTSIKVYKRGKRINYDWYSYLLWQMCTEYKTLLFTTVENYLWELTLEKHSNH